jgi:translation initiation factor IF-2
MQKRFNELPVHLGYNNVDELKNALQGAGIDPPRRLTQAVDEETVETWRKALTPSAVVTEPREGVVRRRRKVVPTGPETVSTLPAGDGDEAVVSVAIRRAEPVEATAAEPVAAGANDEADASGSEPATGVSKRTRFATVVTPEAEEARTAAQAVVAAEAAQVAAAAEAAAAAEVPAELPADAPRRARFATVVTRQPQAARGPEEDDQLGPEASASATPRSRFQTVHTTGAQPVVPLSPTEIAQMNRREADRNATANVGGARVLGSLSREVLTERLEVDRRDFTPGPARPREAVPGAPGEVRPGDDRRRGKKGKRVVQQGDLYDRGRGGRNQGRKGKKNSGPSMPPPKLNPTAEHKRVVRMEEAILVSELAMQMSVKAGELVMKLAFDLGLRGANINTALDFDTATLVAEMFNYKVEQIGFDINNYLPAFDDKDEDYLDRPPVLAVMGHVDHGKTSLLDRIRETAVASGEAGGITQHIGAYKIIRDTGEMTMLDTPGHEAFSALRARGATATDIVILVVAADDGVMPQTVEAIKLAQAAETPIIVALNKMDKEGADPGKIKQSLTEYELVPEEWGGSTIFVETSAKTGEGIDSLLEMVHLQAEVMELRANPLRFAEGLVIESKLDTGRGPVATVLVQQGTLRQGQTVVIGQFYGRVRTLSDERGGRKTEALPSTPVEITGLNGVPSAGEKFYVVDSEKNAKAIAEHVASQVKQIEMAVSITGQDSMAAVDDFMKAAQQKELKVIVKADVQGSVQALVQSLKKLSTDKVRVRVIHSGVGAIVENDINMATSTSDSEEPPVLIGFNTRAEQRAQALADQHGMAILTESVIYHILDQIREKMRLLLDPVYVEEYIGKAECRAVFDLSSGMIAGCMVQDGVLERNARCRVMRKGTAVHQSSVQSIRHHKDDVREIRSGFECGIQVHGFTAFEEGDIIEGYRLKEVAAEL